MSKFWRDASERAVWTFAQGALAAAPLGPVSDWSAVRSAGVTMAVAGGAAVLSLAKAMLARRVGDPASASFLSS